MATREENLKKINAELKKLSDEELDNVAGGYLIWHLANTEALANENDPSLQKPNQNPYEQKKYEFIAV